MLGDHYQTPRRRAAPITRVAGLTPNFNDAKPPWDAELKRRSTADWLTQAAELAERCPTHPHPHRSHRRHIEKEARRILKRHL